MDASLSILSTNHRRESKFAREFFYFRNITAQFAAYYHFLNVRQIMKAAIFQRKNFFAIFSSHLSCEIFFISPTVSYV